MNGLCSARIALVDAVEKRKFPGAFFSCSSLVFAQVKTFRLCTFFFFFFFPLWLILHYYLLFGNALGID